MGGLFRLNNGEIMGSPYDSDKLILAKLLVEAMDDLGHPPTFDEARKYPKLPENPNVYAPYFGSFSAACTEARYFVKTRGSPVKISQGDPSWKRAKEARDFQLKLIHADVERSKLRKRRGKMRDEILQENIDGTVDETLEPKKLAEVSVKAPESEVSVKPKAKRRKKSKEELWAEVREKSRELGRLVTLKEIMSDPEMSCPQTYYNKLGLDWREVLEAELFGGAAEKTIEETAETGVVEPELVELPIKIILPKGIKGTIQLTLEF